VTAICPPREAGKTGAEKSDSGNAADGEIKVEARRQTAGLKWFAAFCRKAVTNSRSAFQPRTTQSIIFANRIIILINAKYSGRAAE
jgi:hypothetical protein